MYITVKPVLSGHHFKRTPSIKRTQTPKKYMKWSFLLLPTCIKRMLVIKFHHPTCQTQEMWKIALNCHLQIFRFLHLKTWRAYLIWFTILYCFLFRFVCIKLFSLIWFLQIWVAIYVYGTMINWFTLIKKLMQTSIVIVSGSIINASTVHLNGIWHLIWRYISKPVLGEHPVLSGHYSIPQGCPLNTGFTVVDSIRVLKMRFNHKAKLVFPCLYSKSQTISSSYSIYLKLGGEMAAFSPKIP